MLALCLVTLSTLFAAPGVIEKLDATSITIRRNMSVNTYRLESVQFIHHPEATKDNPNPKAVKLTSADFAKGEMVEITDYGQRITVRKLGAWPPPKRPEPTKATNSESKAVSFTTSKGDPLDLTNPKIKYLFDDEVAKVDKPDLIYMNNAIKEDQIRAKEGKPFLDNFNPEYFRSLSQHRELFDAKQLIPWLCRLSDSRGAATIIAACGHQGDAIKKAQLQFLDLGGTLGRSKDQMWAVNIAVKMKKDGYDQLADEEREFVRSHKTLFNRE